MNEIVKVGEHNITKLEWKGQRVITTAQLAEIYETDINNVQVNFSRNRNKFVEGEHFLFLQGSELKAFKRFLTDSKHPLADELKFTSQFYLWTRRGSSRHCKILGTTKAWEQFDVLEDNYYNPKPQTNKVIDDILNDPDYGIKLLTAYKEEKEARALAEEQKEELQIELDYSKDWYSIKRVAAMNGVSWKTFDWRKLKNASEDMGYGIKKIFDANYGEVNTYHREVWESVYPEYEI